MTTAQPPEDGPRKILAGAAIKIRIAVLGILVLAAGAWLAPRADQSPLTAPPERAAPLLEEQVQQRESAREFVGVQRVAARVRRHSVEILPPAYAVVPGRSDFAESNARPPRPSGAGVYVSDRHVLTHSTALDGRSTVSLRGDGAAPVEGRVVGYEAPTGLVLLETAPSGSVPAALAQDAPPPGALAVGVGRSAERDVVVPVFVTAGDADEYAIGAVVGSVQPGMPVFTLGGELFAIAAPEGRELRAIAVRAPVDRLLGRVAGVRRSSFGVGVQPVSGALTRAFGDDGVVVTDVLDGGPADLAGIQVGDVLMTVGGVEVTAVEDATEALGTAAIGVPAPWRVRRGRRILDIEVTPAAAYEVAALARAAARGSTAPEARALFPAAVLDAAAIPPTAEVLAINGRPVSSRAQAQGELRRARTPIPVLLALDGTRFFAVVEPTR